MNEQVLWRDYNVTYVNAKRAEEMGLANAEWYSCAISRAEMKELMQRRDGPAIRDTIIWFAAFIVSGSPAISPGAPGGRAVLPRLRRALWRLDRLALARMRPRHRLQDALDERRRLPDRLLHDHARADDVWRWSHTRHHTDTIIVGRDPEIAVMRPPDLIRSRSSTSSRFPSVVPGVGDASFVHATGGS